LKKWLNHKESIKRDGLLVLAVYKPNFSILSVGDLVYSSQVSQKTSTSLVLQNIWSVTPFYILLGFAWKNGGTVTSFVHIRQLPDAELNIC
jgi:hypothetical protein